ncbi:hypothetical protein [Sphingomonas sp.]|uniref:hypothetical protein n=1 Tax=Sphingomonas sp. TaxID=28214 RepID=UPI0028AC6340|nr:hypothetical protein [Sphingomonas sp.]
MIKIMKAVPFYRSSDLLSLQTKPGLGAAATPAIIGEVKDGLKMPRRGNRLPRKWRLFALEAFVAEAGVDVAR